VQGAAPLTFCQGFDFFFGSCSVLYLSASGFRSQERSIARPDLLVSAHCQRRAITDSNLVLLTHTRVRMYLAARFIPSFIYLFVLLLIYCCWFCSTEAVADLAVLAPVRVARYCILQSFLFFFPWYSV